MAETDFKCGNCEYFVNKQIMGICRLYPMQQNKHETDWCGQHKAIQYRSIYDIKTDETVVVPMKRKYTKKSDV
jgi:hypothetical protein